ncbi:MAG: hypothetical protein MJ170_01560 [Alphaproteobacteria bacterium]|nr:hypothetical protein [Alphaproteobacteria bacterium]
MTFIKYIAAAYILLAIFLAPVWLARQTKVNKTIMCLTRIFNWLFGWTGIGWLLGLFMASKKHPSE